MGVGIVWGRGLCGRSPPPGLRGSKEHPRGRGRGHRQQVHRTRAFKAVRTLALGRREGVLSQRAPESGWGFIFPLRKRT